MGNSAALGRFPRAGRGPRSALLLRVASDERLVELVRGGSEAAFETVYDRHHRGILAFCRHMLSSADEAEDALQHTFMSAYRHLVGGEADIQLRPWLYTIARNRCLSMLRARRERPLDEVHEPATEHLTSEAQRRQDVRELLADVAALPDDQRAALVLAEIGDVSHDEIAMVLEVPRQKVKALVFQARTSLAASRAARDTPCEEIREQLANLRGGALRRTTLHRHVRECAGCKAFRDEVALQRKTLAVALPVLPTLGLKEAALGAAFSSAGAGAGGGAAAATGSALAAKALVAVALVGGGATAGVEVTRHVTAPPTAAERSAAPDEPAPAGGGAVLGERRTLVPAASVPLGRRAPAAPAKPGRVERGHGALGKAKGRHKAKHAAPADARPEHAVPDKAQGEDNAEHAGPEHAKAERVTPGKAEKAAPQAKAPRAEAKPKVDKVNVKSTPPGQAKKAAPEIEVKAVEPVLPAAVPTVEARVKLKERHR